MFSISDVISPNIPSHTLQPELNEMLTHFSIIPHWPPTKVLQRAATAAKFDPSHKSLAAMLTISLDLDSVGPLPAPATG
jgi:hypothetical protein